MNDRELGSRIEQVERRAWIEGERHLPPEILAALGRRIACWGEVVAIATDSTNSLVFNRVMGVGLHVPADDRLLDAIAAHYAAGPNDHSINLSPHAEPADLPARLARRGYATYFDWIKWWRDDAPAPAVATPLRIAHATAADAAIVVEIATNVFGQSPPAGRGIASAVGVPGWHHFVARDGDTAVAIAAMFTDGDCAWLGAGATLPSYRGRGAQGALIAARIEAARAAGCRLLTVETGPDSPERPNPSYHNVERMGFRVAYRRPSWVFPDPAKRAR